MALSTPATALWNQRTVVAERQNELRRLINVVGRPTDLCLYQWAQLMAFALEFQPDVILELGRGLGNSTCCFLEVAEMLAPRQACQVVSLSLDEHWRERTAPRLKAMRPAAWFARGQMLHQDIAKSDARQLLGDAKRCFVFWDAHGFQVAEWVLGRLLPTLLGREHVVAIHDMCDLRYCTPPRDYRECGMWKGENGEETGFSFGHVFSRVSQAVSVVDFAARNQLPLRSSDESYFAELGEAPEKSTELKRLLGEDAFSLNGHWFWFNLDEAPCKLTFPTIGQPSIRPPSDLPAATPPSLWRRALGRAKMSARQLVNRCLAINDGVAPAPAAVIAAAELAAPVARSSEDRSGVCKTSAGGGQAPLTILSEGPAHSDTECFDSEEANAINEARLDHLEGLGLELHGRRLLDVGCGVGHLGNYYSERGCQVVCLDGRVGNIRSLRKRYPHLEAHVADVERTALRMFGAFDIVLCYGLLYHLENPLAALRNCASVGSDLLLVESVVVDHPDPVLALAEETGAANQALHGVGCRPSASYLVKALRVAGFPYVYAPRQPPRHPDYEFPPMHDLTWRRDGHLLRRMLVAARHPLSNPNLHAIDAAALPVSMAQRSEQPWIVSRVS